MMPGCSSLNSQNDNTPIQENLLTKCPLETPSPAGKAGKEVLTTLLEWEKFYNECAIRHDGLVDAVRKMKMVKVTK